MSILNVASLKHESALVDNLVLDSSGNTTFAGAATVGNIVLPSGGSLAVKDSSNVDTYIGVDSAGRVTMPYQPYFYAGSTHSGTYINGAVMPYDTVSTNTGSHYNTSTYLFTAPIAGRYLFTVSALNYPSSSTGELFFSVNGSSYNPLFRDNSVVPQQSISGSAVINLSANDTVGVSGTLYFYATSGHGHFSGTLIN